MPYQVYPFEPEMFKRPLIKTEQPKKKDEPKLTKSKPSFQDFCKTDKALAELIEQGKNAKTDEEKNDTRAKCQARLEELKKEYAK